MKKKLKLGGLLKHLKLDELLFATRNLFAYKLLNFLQLLKMR